MTPGEWRPRGPDRLKASTQSVGITPALGQGRLGEGRHLGLLCITPRGKNNFLGKLDVSYRDIETGTQ